MAVELLGSFMRIAHGAFNPFCQSLHNILVVWRLPTRAASSVRAKGGREAGTLTGKDRLPGGIEKMQMLRGKVEPDLVAVTERTVT